MSLKIINANIKRVARNSAAWNALVQDTAVLCIEHSIATGDANPALRLVQAMPNSVKRPAIINWFKTYSRINLDVGKGACSLSKKVDRLDDVAGAKANNWFEREEVTKEDLPSTMDDALGRVEILVKWMETRLKSNKVAPEAVADFTAKLGAIKALTVGKTADVVSKPVAKAA